MKCLIRLSINAAAFDATLSLGSVAVESETDAQIETFSENYRAPARYEEARKPKRGKQ